MENEHARTMEALQLAIQMEVEGKKFYQQASDRSGNKLAKELFQRLANEEDDHSNKFREIYAALKKGLAWPEVEPPSHKTKAIKSVFAEATIELGDKIKVAESELEAVKTAIDMELKTYDLYRSRSKEGSGPQERLFYEALAAEERGHHLALLDFYEYLSDPSGWFVMKEHRLDGI
jgi:rubrerythrin